MFCSYKCKYKYIENGGIVSGRQAKPIKLVCFYCGVELYGRPSDIKRGIHFSPDGKWFCKKCLHDEIIRSRFQICKLCGRVFYNHRAATGNRGGYRQQFCNKECSDANIRQYGKTNKMKKKEDREKLGDEYIKKLLSRYSILSGSEFPAELVEAKRAQINLKRTIRKGLNHANKKH
jgi:hypothetical protein